MSQSAGELSFCIWNNMVNYQACVMVEIRSSLTSQPSIFDDWLQLKSKLFLTLKTVMLTNYFWIQYLWLQRPLVMTAVRKK